MGKGDIRTRRGKVWRGTYGVTRPRRWKTTTPVRVAKPRKVKALKDLPKAVEVEPIKIVTPKEHVHVVETVQPIHHEPQVHVVETKPEPVEVKAPVVAEEHKPIVEPVAEVSAVETHEVETPAVQTHEAETPSHHTEEKTAKKKAKAPAKKASKPAAKKAPAAKKPAAAKKAPAKKKK